LTHGTPSGTQPIVSQRGSAIPAGMSLWAVQYGFTGYIADQETGLLHARARQYSPTLGRFSTKDFKFYPDGWNLYLAYFVPGKLDPEGAETKSGAVTEGTVKVTITNDSVFANTSLDAWVEVKFNPSKTCTCCSSGATFNTTATLADGSPMQPGTGAVNQSAVYGPPYWTWWVTAPGSTGGPGMQSDQIPNAANFNPQIAPGGISLTIDIMCGNFKAGTVKINGIINQSWVNIVHAAILYQNNTLSFQSPWLIDGGACPP